MPADAKDVWIFQIVHQDTGKPAQGVPVTVLDAAGNPAGYWVSDPEGIVAIPRRDTAKLRLRVGLRNEDPIELNPATLGEGPTPLAAPTQLPPTVATGGERGEWSERGERGEREAAPPPPRPTEPQLARLTLTEPDLEGAAADPVHRTRDGRERMSQGLRRRPLGVVDAEADTPAGGAIRTVRNTSRDRLVTFHFFEPLERFKVMVRSPRVRPVIFVPFRLPNVATPELVRRSVS